MKYVGSARCDESTLYVVTRIVAPPLAPPSDIIIVDPAFLLLVAPCRCRESSLASFSRRVRKYFSAGTRSMPLAYISQSSSHVTFECVSNVTTPPAYTSRTTTTTTRDDLNFVSVSLFRFVVTLFTLSLFLSLSSKAKPLFVFCAFVR